MRKVKQREKRVCGGCAGGRGSTGEIGEGGEDGGCEEGTGVGAIRDAAGRGVR